MDAQDQSPVSAGVTQDQKNLALILWIATIFFAFIPGLLMYLAKQDDAYLFSQSKEALNWAITATIVWAAGVVLTFVVIGIFVLMALAIVHLVFCIMGVAAATKGENFRVPFSVRLIK